jgi:very-short-patch-repair endonuclease
MRLRSRALLGCKLRRQDSIAGFIVDFCCLEKRLIIELDGEQHAEQQRRYDEARSKELEDLGFKVIRFWNSQIVYNVEGVLIEIGRALAN